MKAAMAKRKAQHGQIKDQIMDDWKSGRITAEEAQLKLKQAGVS